MEITNISWSTLFLNKIDNKTPAGLFLGPNMNNTVENNVMKIMIKIPALNNKLGLLTNTPLN